MNIQNPEAMKIAVIDLGTNTFHMLIAEVAGGSFKALHKEKSAVKIGQNGINEGNITEDAMIRAFNTLKKFKHSIDDANVDQVFATATSAIRNAKNGNAFVDLIKAQIGIDVRIISGKEEAEYIYYGVSHALNLGDETSLIMDIGGGSIEFIIGNSNQIFWLHSFEVGGLRMTEKFQKHDPILQSEAAQVRSYLIDHLNLLFKKTQQFNPLTLVGSSGTFDTLSDIYRIARGIEKSPANTEYPLTHEAFEAIYEDIISKDRQQRLAIPGMIELRVDMIVVACILIKLVLDTTGIKNIRVSGYALKEGVLLKTIHQLKSITKSPELN